MGPAAFVPSSEWAGQGRVEWPEGLGQPISTTEVAIDRWWEETKLTRVTVLLLSLLLSVLIGIVEP